MRDSKFDNVQAARTTNSKRAKFNYFLGLYRFRMICPNGFDTLDKFIFDTTESIIPPITILLIKPSIAFTNVIVSSLVYFVNTETGKGCIRRLRVLHVTNLVCVQFFLSPVQCVIFFSVVLCMTLCTIPFTCVPSHGSPNILPFVYHGC